MILKSNPEKKDNKKIPKKIVNREGCAQL